jgi:chromate transporter
MTTLILMLITMLLIWKVKKMPEQAIVALAAVVGLIVYPMMKT